MESLLTRLENFKQITESTVNFDDEHACVLLRELKIVLVKFNYLSVNCTEAPIGQRIIFREILELATILNLRLKKHQEIQDLFSQLKFFYYENPDLPTSQRMNTIIGLNLLVLLCTDQFDEYLTTLSQALAHFTHINLYLQFVMDVERCLSDNSLTQLFILQKNCPSILYEGFVQDIIGNVRKSLANDILRQCEYFTINELKKILHFKSIEKARRFIRQCNWEYTEDGAIIATKEKKVKKKTQTMEMKYNNVFIYAEKFNLLV